MHSRRGFLPVLPFARALVKRNGDSRSHILLAFRFRSGQRGQPKVDAGKTGSNSFRTASGGGGGGGGGVELAAADCSFTAWMVDSIDRTEKSRNISRV